MKPAARITDMHTCPMVTPGVPPIPHVGGPINTVGSQAVCVGPPDVVALGSFTVLLSNKPAARMGDMTGHGGVIVAGCPTVLIGG